VRLESCLLSSFAVGIVQVRACRRKATRGVDTQGRRGRDTGSYVDRGERCEVRYDRAKWREISTLSGGEQKRLALEALLRRMRLLLDEPDNFLDVPAKRWLENQLQSTQKSVLLVSHDRELLAQTAKTIAVLELAGAGNTVWIHGSGFATLAAAAVTGLRAWRNCGGAGTSSTKSFAS
jgi:ABC-type sugar transport system ATPase subunit